MSARLLLLPARPQSKQLQDSRGCGDGRDASLDPQGSGTVESARLLVKHLPGRHNQADHGRRRGLGPSDIFSDGDFSSLTRVGDQAGSNPGGVYEASDGSRYYVKAQKSGAHAANEALAADLYRAAGIDIPEVIRGEGAPGLKGPQTASRMVDGAKGDLEDRLGDKDRLAAVQAGFAVDAWLANWDVAGQTFDNIVSDKAGKPHRIDAGGALLFRAQGGEKGTAFGEVVAEWDSLRDPSRAPQAAQLFGAMTPEQLAESARKVKAVTPAKIRQLVERHGLESSLADTLIARRKDLLARVNPPAAAKRWEARAAKATRGDLVPDQAGARFNPTNLYSSDPTGELTFREGGLPDAVASGSALADYVGDGYKNINGWLRHGQGHEWGNNRKQQVRDIDRAMKAAPLAKDVVVYRGIRDATTVFGDSAAKSLKGRTWTEKGYLSTTFSEVIARNFASDGWDKQHLAMRIVMPAGSGAIAVQGGESELLGQRNLKLRVVRDNTVGVLAGKLMRVIDVEVVT